MRNLLLMVLMSFGVSAQTLTIITSDVTIVENKPEQTLTIGTQSRTTMYQGTTSNIVSIHDSGTATITLLNTLDDGKGRIGHIFRINPGGSDKVMLVQVNDIGPQNPEGTRHWIFGGVDSFEIQDGISFVLYTMEITRTTHRGVQIYHRPDFPPSLPELDRALDLAGDNWSTDVIYQYDELTSIGGYLGLARNREFIVSRAGFETHVILHENGHNYDLENPDYLQQMTAIYPEGGFPGYYTGPVSEFRAEMFARYYLLRDEMPQVIRSLLDTLL